jgi:16S rRNA processing protein RimM
MIPSLSKYAVGPHLFDVRIGSVSGLHGLKGRLKIKSEFNNPTLVLSAREILFVTEDGALQFHCEIDQIRFEQSSFYLLLRDHNSRTEVEKYCGLDAYVLKSELAQLTEDEWWASDLVGLQVFSVGGELIGTVSDVLGEHGELLEVTKIGSTNEEPVLVPFAKALVPVVDLAAKRIEIDPIPGLFD